MDAMVGPMRTLLVGLGGLYIAIVAALGSASAEDSVPLRAGRVSVADGAASYRPAGGDWSGAVVNLPVATGTALRTDENGSAEFRVGDAVVTLAPKSEIFFSRLEPHTIELAVHRGRIAVVVRSLGDGDEITVTLQRGAVRLLQPGRYDIDAGAESGPPKVAAFEGSARFAGDGPETTIPTGSVARLDTPATVETAVADAFDKTWRGRLAEGEPVAARLHLSPELTGLAELDRAGHWQAIDNYGAVWFPDQVAEGWAPYRDGCWRWIPPWGWTWVDKAAWGFAPSHYGRWARFDDRWGWIPGKPVWDPAYAPAVVAFLGTPPVGLSYADAFSPAIAWFPLGPGEIYWPGFSRDSALIRRLNAPDIDDLWTIHHADNGGPPPELVTGDYRNRRDATAVPRAVFIAGQPVAAARVAIPEARLETAPVIAETTPFPPAPAPRTVASAASPSKGPALIAAARAALPILAAAAHSRLHALAHAMHDSAAVSHLAVLRRGAHAAPAGRPRVMASLSVSHSGGAHRHLAALHGRAR